MNVPSNFLVTEVDFDSHVDILPVEGRNLDERFKAIVLGLCKPSLGLYVIDDDVDTYSRGSLSVLELTCMVKSEEGLALLFKAASRAKEAFQAQDILTHCEQSPVRLELYWNGDEENSPSWQLSLELEAGPARDYRRNIAIFEEVVLSLSNH